MNAAPALAGQSVGLIDKIESVDKIIKKTIHEFNEVCNKMPLQVFNKNWLKIEHIGRLMPNNWKHGQFFQKV